MKLSALLTGAGIMALTAFSCAKKDQDPATVESQTIDVTLNAGEEYRYVLPSTNSETTYSIEQASMQSASVSIETNNGSSSMVYVPLQNSGNDTVVVTSGAQQHCQGGHKPKRHHGKPKNKPAHETGVTKRMVFCFKAKETE